MAKVQRRSHEPLRVPDNWRGQDRQLVIQLERLLDDIYQKLGFDASGIEQEIADLQTGLDGKLDKTKVYNGLDKTSSGFALDARQGKELNTAISGKKDTQTAVSDPTASGTTLSFIATISQDTQGVISATKSSVKTANNVTTTASGSVLDARQGKVLKDAIDAVDDKIFVPSTAASNLTDKSIANNTVVNLGSVTLNKGLYLMFGTATFAANATGYRRLIFADSSTGSSLDRFSVLSVGASADGVTQLQLAWVKNITADSTKVYLNARQTSGGSLNITYPGIRYVKLS